MDKQIIIKLHKSFKDCVHSKDGIEFWYARELQILLGYDEWRNFENVVNKAKAVCESVDQRADDHFVEVNKMVS